MTAAERNLLIGVAQSLLGQPDVPLQGLLEAVQSERQTQEFLQSYIERTTAPRNRS